MSVLMLLCLLSQASQQEAQPLARNRYNRLIETGADVLEPGEHQVAALYGEYALGLLPRFQLSSHLVGVLVSYINLTAKYQLVKREDFTLSLSAGGGWLGLAHLLGISFVTVPVDVRATLPLGQEWELSLGPSVRGLFLQAEQAAQQSWAFSTEMNVVRYDSFGAWYLKGTLPLVSYQRATLSRLIGSPVVGDLLLDNVSAVSFLAGRDLLLGNHFHIRGGLGYRNRPGLVFVESLGQLLIELNLFVRWGGPSSENSDQENPKESRERLRQKHSL